MRFIRHIIHLNSLSLKKGMLATFLLASVLLFVSCSAVATVFVPQDTYLENAQDIEESARTVTPLSGGEITVPMPTNLNAFNPLTAKNINMINLYSLIFESPLTLDNDGRLRAELVENWTYDSTGQVWTFYLRKDIKWHSGFGELTADDFVYTLNLILDLTDEDSRYARYNRRIGEFYAQDKYTFVLNAVDPVTLYDDEAIAQTSSYIEYAMTFPVLCKAYYENDEDIDNLWPIGTGPYEFTSFYKEDGIRLDVNDDWWKKKPYIASIHAIPISDAAEEIEAYARQQIDLVGTGQLSANRYRKYGVTNVEEYMTQYYDCLVPNLYLPKNSEAKKNLVHDVRGRKAIAYALNKSRIISKVLVNHAVATDVPIPPDNWLYDSTLDIYENNEKEAIRLLEDMGYTEVDEDGFRAKIDPVTDELITCKIELMYPKDIRDSYKTNIASLIEEQLEDLGIRVDLRELSTELFMIKVRAGSFDVALMSFYLSVNPDPRFMLHSSRQTSNFGYYKDERMDDALLACGSVLTDAEKKAAYTKMQQLFIDQLPQIALYFRTNSLIYDDSIKGISGFRALNIYSDIQRWYVISEVH